MSRCTERNAQRVTSRWVGDVWEKGDLGLDLIKRGSDSQLR